MREGIKLSTCAKFQEMLLNTAYTNMPNTRIHKATLFPSILQSVRNSLYNQLSSCPS